MDIGLREKHSLNSSLSAAFDTVPHSILLHHLSALGMGGSVWDWCKPFLSARDQSVWLAPFSEVRAVNQGVPPGSSLSPTLFNILVGPLASVVEPFGCKIISYTEDTQLLFAFEDLLAFIAVPFSICMRAVFDWMESSQIKSSNAEKTEIISFGSHASNW